MKRLITVLLAVVAILLALNATALTQLQAEGRTDVSYQVYWEKFRAAVMKGNKPAVADLSQFPIAMPYGLSSIKNRAQLVRRFREVFNHEGSAAKCFASAKPTIDPERPKEFTVGCKNSAGHEVVIYSFVQTRLGWKFSGLDNLNE